MAVSLAALTAIAAIINGRLSGAAGAGAALVAGALVSVGMFAALWFSGLAQRDRRAIHLSLAAQLVRLGCPLVGVLALQWSYPSLADASLFGCVLGIYLPALLIETILAVRMISSAPKREVCHG